MARFPNFLRPLIRREVWIGSAAEFIATFLFVYLGCGAVVSSGVLLDKLDASRLLVIASAHGLAIAALASATAGLSGGHINPAVTFGMVVVKLIPLMQGIMYIIAQFLGAIAGAGLVNGIPEELHGGLGAHSLNPELTEFDGFVFEFVLTFTLVFVIFGTAVDSPGTRNTAPLAIGFTVFVDHLVGVPFTGASMNPARTLGPAVWKGEWQGFRIYLIGPLLGAACAAFAYTQVFLNLESKNSKLQNALPIKIHSMENPIYERSAEFGATSLSGCSQQTIPNIYMV